MRRAICWFNEEIALELHIKNVRQHCSYTVYVTHDSRLSLRVLTSYDDTVHDLIIANHAKYICQI